MNHFDFLYKEENTCVADFAEKFFRWLEGHTEEEFIQHMHDRIGVLSQGCLLELVFYFYFQKVNHPVRNYFKPLTTIDRYSTFFSYVQHKHLVDAIMRDQRLDVTELWKKHKVSGERKVRKILIGVADGHGIISDFDFIIQNKGSRRTNGCLVVVPEDKKNFLQYENALNNLDIGKHPTLINEIYLFNGLKHIGFSKLVRALEEVSIDYEYDADRCKFVVIDKEFVERLATEKPLSNIELRTLMRNGN